MKTKTVFLIIIILAMLTGCSSRRAAAEPYETYTVIDTFPVAVNAPVTPAAIPLTTACLAAQFIQNMIQDFDRPHVQIAETRIDRFEKIGEYEHPTAGMVELWAFNFSIRVEYEPFVRFSGANAQPGPGGWTHPVPLLGNMVSHLVFARQAGDLTLLGAIDWNTTIRVPEAETPWTTEMLLTQFLEHINLLLPVTFPGNHRLVYVHMEDNWYMRFLVSQPVIQGDGGIWAIERWQNFGHWGTNDVVFDIPQCDVLTIAEFYAEQQHRFDAGQEPHLGDPVAVVHTFLDGFIRYETIVGVYDASGPNPMARTNAHGPFHLPDAQQPHHSTEWPTDFRGDFVYFREYVQLRERKLAELGGLAFNQAYHFRMDCGRFALISGWRPMLTHEEFTRYHRGYDIPRQLGDFILAGINVQDYFLDAIRVYNRPVPPNFLGPANNLFANYESLPGGEVFARNLYVAAIYAVYVNSHGQYVVMGITPSFGANIPDLMWGMQYSRVSLGGYGEFYFIGGRDRYAVAMFKNARTQQIIELGFMAPGFPVSEILDAMSGHDFRGIRTATGAELTELIYAFNPRELFEKYVWLFTQ